MCLSVVTSFETQSRAGVVPINTLSTDFIKVMAFRCFPRS